MQGSRRRFQALVFLSLFSVALSASHQGTASICPESCISRQPHDVVVCNTTPQRDTTFTACDAQDLAGYDIPGGTLYAHSLSGFGGCGPAVTVEDDFTLTGIPGDPIVSLVARFDLTLMRGCILGPGFASASIREGAANSDGIAWDICSSAEEVMTATLRVSFVAAAGVPFRMRYELLTEGGEFQALFGGRFAFEGLPANAAITSCNGFLQGPVQTLSTTWGRIKSGYR